jgi:hypothetical protein
MVAELCFGNSVWLTAMIRSENYQHKRHEKNLKQNDFASIFFHI